MHRQARSKKRKIEKVIKGIRNDPLGKYNNISVDQAGRQKPKDN